MLLSYPAAGRLIVRNVPFFGEPDGEQCRTFIGVLLDLVEVREVSINKAARTAEIRFDPRCTPETFGRKLAARLKLPIDRPTLPVPLRPDPEGMVRLHRCGAVVSTWKVVSDIPGRIRLRNNRLFRRRKLCHDIERELMTVMGVERFRTSSIACSILIFYDPKNMGTTEVLTILDEILQNAEEHPHVDRNKYEMLLCSGAVVLAATAQFAASPLLIPAAALFLWCVIPTFIGARRTLFVERRLGVDVLDAIVVVMCLISGEVFAGAVLAWCLAFGRGMLEKAQEDSRRRLVSVFAKQPRTAYLIVDGVEVNVPLDRVKAGDLIAVGTGEMVPVDGTVFEGMAVIDQHALTGESVPVEKEPGSRVYASTLVLAGRILVTVERAGRETTSSRITTILNETAMYRLVSQSKGETLADRAVIPTLALGALGYASGGIHVATAIVNCDFGTGIRMAAPLALLSSLAVCANRGILIKDGRALEEMNRIDTVLFDKTGTLTKERPSVARIHTFGTASADEVLTCAAAAEQRLGHPIAAAIVDAFAALHRPFPPTDSSSFRIGYGISVRVDGREVLVGSGRYLRLENIDLPATAERVEEKAHDAGNTIVWVAIGGELAGAIELAPSLREGVTELIERLRAHGVQHIVIISGDHEKPTRRLAKSLGVDRYFAGVLPEDKAKHVDLLQKEGRRVCFVGDGINDAIALKRANVSVSIRGATTVATDTAQVVFMEERLGKLAELIDISRGLDGNVATSWRLILAPNLACIAGAFLFGFGVMASVLANNVAAIAALANGLRPLRMSGEDLKKIAPKAKPAAAVSRRRDRVADLIPAGPRARRAAFMLAGAGAAGLFLPGVPGWPLLLLSAAMLIPAKRRPARLERWLQTSLPVKLHRAVRSVLTQVTAGNEKLATGER